MGQYFPPNSPQVQQYGPIIKAAAEKYGVPYHIAIGLVTQESQFNPRARSSVGAQGLMQFMPATAREMGLRGDDVYDLQKAIPAGIKYLSQQRRFVGDDWNKALAAYNGGAGRVQGAVRRGGADWQRYLPAETRNYIPSINGFADRFQKDLVGGGAIPAVGATMNALPALPAIPLIPTADTPQTKRAAQMTPPEVSDPFADGPKLTMQAFTPARTQTVPRFIASDMYNADIEFQDPMELFRKR